MNLFIDTNIFLSFFHLSNNDLEEIHKLAILIEKGDVTLWITEQVKDEFRRNRESKISDAVKKLKEQKTKPQFPQICKDYEEYPQIQELQEDFDKKISSLIKKVNDDVAARTLKADQKIEELFKKAKLVKTTQKLVDKARLRMDVKNPPGKDGSLGDAINWEALLESVTDDEKLHLVADDKDYYSVLDDNKLKDFLSDEWQEKKNEEVQFYRRLSQFFKEHYPDIKLASELEKELSIRALVNSGNFANTHNAVSKLEKYAEFNKSQVNELVQICFTNNQVGWILDDQDIYAFYKSLLDNHGEKLEPELNDKLKEKLKEAEPEEANA
ncbi:hypothetical protein CRYPA_1105 [uncultured Candidatus Thioglobus sp.]|nr:hypothetical protein CRYPA_1105 [uncultured Candidatus Thioglobus sp.]